MGLGDEPRDPADSSGEVRIGVFGGTFDPIHRGHLEVARAAARAADLEQVLLVPAGRPWLRESEPAASPQQRLEMTRLAARDDSLLDVSDVDVVRDGPTYSVDTLLDLRERYGQGAVFVLILGADSALTMDQWSRGDELSGLCEVLVIGRPGETWPSDLPPSHPASRAKYVKGPMLQVSATDLRERLAAGADVSDSLVAAVTDYIRENGLYRAQ